MLGAELGELDDGADDGVSEGTLDDGASVGVLVVGTAGVGAWQITQPELVTEPSARQLKVDPAATARLLGPVEPSYRVPPMVT